MMTELEPVYLTLSLDPVTEICELVGFDRDLEECKQHRSRTDAPYLKTIAFSDNMGQEMFDWLRQCGVTTTESKRLVRGIVKAILEIMEELPDDDSNLLERDPRKVIE